MRSFAIVVALSALCIGTPALSLDVTEMKVIGSKNGWELRQGVDEFTDKVSCVVLKSGSPTVQVTSSSFYIAGGRGNGGLAGYQLRIDSKDPESMTLASDIEKSLGTVIITGGKYQEVLQADRLRVLAIGVLDGYGFQKDIKLSGLKEVLALWGQKGCPTD